MARPRQQRLDPARRGSAPASRTAKGRSGHPAGRPANLPRKATAWDWIDGARLRTLPLAIAPVILGFGASVAVEGPGVYHWLRALGCLAVALCLQIAVNFGNDYSDGIRGTDKYRQGPPRLTGSGRARPRTVLVVALVFFALAAIAGVALVIRTEQWWLLAVGAVAILAAWFYTGGKRPYGYYGFGEVAVFVFFGLVAVAGTQFILAGVVSQEGWLSAVAAGSNACAVLMVNNIRDIDPDRKAGKRTLAVLLGSVGSRIAFCVFALVPFVILGVVALFYPFALLGFFTLLAVLPACLIAVTARTPKELILALKLTSLGGLVYAVFLGLAFVV